MKKDFTKTIMTILNKEAYLTVSKEKVFGVRESWFYKGLSSGLFLGALVFSPKHKALYGSMLAIDVIRNVLSLVNLNDLEKSTKNYMERFIGSLNKEASRTDTIPPDGKIIN